MSEFPLSIRLRWAWWALCDLWWLLRTWRQRDQLADWHRHAYLWMQRIEDARYWFWRRCADCGELRGIMWWDIGECDECLPF